MTVFRLWSHQPLAFSTIYDPEIASRSVFITPLGEHHYHIGTLSDWDALNLSEDEIEQLEECLAKLSELRKRLRQPPPTEASP